MRQLALDLTILLVAVAVGCTGSNPPSNPASTSAPQANGLQDAADTVAEDRPPSAPEKLSLKHVPNPVRVHPRVISGGLPAGDEAFAELQTLGIKTIISVDGAQPDVAAATRHGMRYVHLPHGYDGIPDQRAMELAKAVAELPGPIYIHCHHGKHRSPAAAAVACVGAGLIVGDDALKILEIAGTSPSYRGLFESASKAAPIDRPRLAGFVAEFPERAKLPDMARAMVEVEHTHDHLKALAANRWQMLVDQPALVPEHEALLLREHFTELLRTDEVQKQPAGFVELARQAESLAQTLENDLLAWPASARTAAAPAAVTSAFERVTANCAACHQQFRDVPLSEKQAP